TRMTATDTILAKLKITLEGTLPLASDSCESLVTQPWCYPHEQRFARLRQLMEAVHTEIHLTSDAAWPELLQQLLHDRQLPSLLIAPTTPYGQRFAEYCAGRDDAPTLKAYDRPVEEWKDELFNDTPASLTGTLGAIASTGSLIMWPTR